MAASTHLLAFQPPLLIAFCQALQLVKTGEVRIPQCRNSPACDWRSQVWRGFCSSACAGGAPAVENMMAPTTKAVPSTPTFAPLRQCRRMRLSIATSLLPHRPTCRAAVYIRTVGRLAGGRTAASVHAASANIGCLRCGVNSPVTHVNVSRRALVLPDLGDARGPA